MSIITRLQQGSEQKRRMVHIALTVVLTLMVLGMWFLAERAFSNNYSYQNASPGSRQEAAVSENRFFNDAREVSPSQETGKISTAFDHTRALIGDAQTSINRLIDAVVLFRDRGL